MWKPCSDLGMMMAFSYTGRVDISVVDGLLYDRDSSE